MMVFRVGFLGMDAFPSTSFGCIANISGRNPLENRVPFARLDVAIIQTLTGGMRTRGTGRGGFTVQQACCRPTSENLERTCVEKLGVKTRNKLHTSSIRIESFLKFMRNMYFLSFLFCSLM